MATHSTYGVLFSLGRLYLTTVQRSRLNPVGIVFSAHDYVYLSSLNLSLYILLRKIFACGGFNFMFHSHEFDENVINSAAHYLSKLCFEYKLTPSLFLALKYKVTYENIGIICYT